MTVCTGDCLDQVGLILSTSVELLPQPRSKHRSHHDREQDEERNARQRHTGQNPAVEEHHRQEHHGEDEVEDDIDGRAGEELADVLELAHPRDRIPYPPQLEIPQWDMQEVTEESCPERHIDPVSRMHQEVRLQDR